MNDEIAELALRLEQINPGRCAELLEVLRDMVAAQEVLAAHRNTLLLRPKRTLKKYSA